MSGRLTFSHYFYLLGALERVLSQRKFFLYLVCNKYFYKPAKNRRFPAVSRNLWPENSHADTLTEGSIIRKQFQNLFPGPLVPYMIYCIYVTVTLYPLKSQYNMDYILPRKVLSIHSPSFCPSTILSLNLHDIMIGNFPLNRYFCCG